MSPWHTLQVEGPGPPTLQVLPAGLSIPGSSSVVDIPSGHQWSAELATNAPGTSSSLLLPSLPNSHLDADASFETARVSDIVMWVRFLFPELESSLGRVKDLISQAYEAGSAVFGAQQAQEWAAGFRIPPQAISTDKEAFASCNSDFLALVRLKQRHMPASRFNED